MKFYSREITPQSTPLEYLKKVQIVNQNMHQTPVILEPEIVYDPTNNPEFRKIGNTYVMKKGLRSSTVMDQRYSSSDPCIVKWDKNQEQAGGEAV